jgi:hypothetical protein
MRIRQRAEIERLELLSPQPSISRPDFRRQAAGKPKRQLQSFYEALNISGIAQPVFGGKM